MTLSPSSGLKPLGPYETWEDCIAAQIARGHDDEAAARICGAIERDTEALARAGGPEAAVAEALDVFVETLRGYKRRRRPSAADQQYVRALDRIRRKLEPQFAGDLRSAFKKLGPIARAAYERGKGRKDADAETRVLVDKIVERIDFDAYRDRVLRKPYERLYIESAEMTFGAVSQRLGIEIGFSLADEVGRKIVAEGGKRMGLLDLAGDTRSALFRALHETRVEGLGADDTARLITQYVPAGRFAGQGVVAGSLYRSTMIARTETRYAQGISATRAGEKAGIEQFLVFDARIGDTDEECEALDGQIVDADEAIELMADEHPNGTRSISPLPRD